MPFSATRDLWLVLKARDETTRALRGFSRDIRLVGDSVRMANLQASRSALMNQMATQRLTGATAAQMLVTQRSIQQNDRQIASMRIARAASEEHRVAMQRLSGSMTGAASAAGALGLALTAAGFFGLMGMKNLINSQIEYAKQSALTRTQVEGFVNSQKEIEDVGLRIARTIPAQFEQIQPALFDIFSSMDVGIKDAEKLLREFSKASVAGQTDIVKAGRSTIGILNAFQLPIKDVNHLLDLQFQLVQEGLGTYEEWAGRIGLVTPSAVRAGQSVEMMVAALAAATRMGIPAARSATAVSRAMDAMSNPKSIGAIKKFGVAIVDAKGNFRPMIDFMTELRDKLMKIPGEAARTAKMLDLFKGAGSTIEARRFLQNMLLKPGNLELFKTIFTEMSEQSGSFEQAYAMMADTTFAKSQLLSNQWQSLKVMAGEALAPAFLSVVGLLSKLVEWFNNLDPKTKKFITTTLAITLALVSLAGIFAIIVGAIAAFVAAFVVAGSSLLVVLGILGALAISIGAFVAGIAIAWAKSEGFREAIKRLAEEIRIFWQEYIVPTGLAVRDAWNKHMAPALGKLVAFMRSEVAPVFQTLADFMKSEVVNAVKEVGNNVKDFLINAFRTLGNIIETFVIPAIAFLTKFYRENEETIRMLVKWAVELGKWFIKLVAIITLILATPIVGVIIGIVVAFAGLVVAVIKVIDWLRQFWNWLSINIPQAWGFLVEVFKSAMSFLATAWSNFWNSDIIQMVRSAVNFIMSIINLLFTIIIKVVQIGLVVMFGVWKFYWSKIQNFVASTWATILSGLRVIWSIIVTVAKGLWDRLRAVILEPTEGVRRDIISVFGKIRQFFADAGSWLFNAGKEIVLGLIRGIREKFNEATRVANELAQKIKDFWPFSPAKIGPLSGTGSPFHAGQNIARQLAEGMQSGMKQIAAITGNMSAFAAPDGVAPYASLPSRGGRSVSQTFNITTNEINPRRHAAELGWAISGRM